MNIIVLTHYYWPHIGGVEKHAEEVNKRLVKRGNEITVVTEKYERNLKENEIKDEIQIKRFKYPKLKIIGLVSVWAWLFRNRDLIRKSDLIQIHDVFIWYLPFRFLYPRKKVFTTIHGMEWDNPFSVLGIWQKRMAVRLSTGSIGIGKYLEKYLKVKFNKILYGGAN